MRALILSLALLVSSCSYAVSRHSTLKMSRGEKITLQVIDLAAGTAMLAVVDRSLDMGDVSGSIVGWSGMAATTLFWLSAVSLSPQHDPEFARFFKNHKTTAEDCVIDWGRVHDSEPSTYGMRPGETSKAPRSWANPEMACDMTEGKL